jgi:hypothetical protein
MLIGSDDGRPLGEAWRGLSRELAVRLWLIALGVALVYGAAWAVAFLV